MFYWLHFNPFFSLMKKNQFYELLYVIIRLLVIIYYYAI